MKKSIFPKANKHRNPIIIISVFNFPHRLHIMVNSFLRCVHSRHDRHLPAMSYSDVCIRTRNKTFGISGKLLWIADFVHSVDCKYVFNPLFLPLHTPPWQWDHPVHTPPTAADPGQQNKIKLFKVKKMYWFPVEKLLFIEKYENWCWVGWLDEYNLNKMEMLCFALL